MSFVHILHQGEVSYGIQPQSRRCICLSRELSLKEAQIGDVIQLSFEGNAFGHSVFVIDLDKADAYVAPHTDDQVHRPLHTYSYAACRLLHIDGARE